VIDQLNLLHNSAFPIFPMHQSLVSTQLLATGVLPIDSEVDK